MDPRWNRGERRVEVAETINSAGCRLSLMNLDSRGLLVMGSGSRDVYRGRGVGENESDASVETPTYGTFSHVTHSRQVWIYLVEALHVAI
jgi:hypothetical protein